MAQNGSNKKWTPEKIERFKRLVLRHVANGGTIMDACEQFEYETQGLFKKHASKLRWSFIYQYQCKLEYNRALEIGRKVKMLQLDEQEEAADNHSVHFELQTTEDELSYKVVSAIQELMEDRRHVIQLSQNYRTQFEAAERQIEELNEERKLTELRVAKKEKEIERLQQEIRDKQFQNDQLVSDFNQLRTSNMRESEKLLLQLKEEQLKYDQLMAETKQLRTRFEREIENLQQELKVKHQKYEQLLGDYTRVAAENDKLTKNIAAFTQQLNSMFSSESTGQIILHRDLKNEAETKTTDAVSI